MKRFAVAIFVLAIVFACLAAAALYVLPHEMAKAEARMPALSSAMRHVVDDGMTLSDVVNRYSSLKSTKEESLAAMLADRVLNRLAINYLNKDFSLVRREFLGHVKSRRASSDRLKTAASASEAIDDELHREVVELERRKKSLAEETFVNDGSDSARRRWNVLMDDVDSQLSRLRELDWTRRFKKDVRKESGENAGDADPASQLADQYERATIGVLAKTIEANVVALRGKIERIETMRGIVSALNVWPLNLVAKKLEAAR